MRLVGFVVAGILVAFAAVLPEAPGPPEPEFAGPEVPAVGASAQGSVWYCPWLDSGDIRDSAFLLASIPPTDARVTMPSPIPNEPPIEEGIIIPGPGARMLNVADVVRLGAAPGFVEFDDGPAAAAASVFSPASLSGDRCVRSVPKVWYLAGGTTREGRDIVVRLFNPFPELAKVTVTGLSEFGPEPLPELGEVVDVPGRAWVDIDFAPIAPFLDELLIVVGSEQGLVIPALSLESEGGDDATWPGTGLSTAWEFPMVATDDLVPELVVANPGEVPVALQVDAFELLRSDPLIVDTQVPPETSLRIALPDNDGQPYGIRLTAGGPVAAVVVSESPFDPLEPDEAVPDPEAEAEEEPFTLRLAGTVGVEGPAATWLLPGAGSVPDGETTIWLMNAGEERATVTLQPVGFGDPAAEKIAVSPGRVVGFSVPDDDDVFGYLVESTVPITAAWSASDEGGTAFLAGVAVDD